MVSKMFLACLVLGLMTRGLVASPLIPRITGTKYLFVLQVYTTHSSTESRLPVAVANVERQW